VIPDSAYPNALLLDGTRAMTGDLNMNSKSINNVYYIRGKSGQYLNIASLGDCMEFRMNTTIYMELNALYGWISAVSLLPIAAASLGHSIAPWHRAFINILRGYGYKISIESTLYPAINNKWSLGIANYGWTSLWFAPTTAPVSPTAGCLYFDQATKKLYIFNGTKWEEVQSK